MNLHLLWHEQAEHLLLNGQAVEVLSLLDQVQVNEQKMEQRIMFHMRAQAQIYLGDFEGAKSNLLRAEKFCGEHISILRELACLYYQTGEIHQWRQSVTRLHERLELIGPRLSFETWAQTKVTLGKFLEEDGRVSEAIDAFHLVYAQARERRQEPLCFLALIQLLRLEALFNRGPDLGNWYRELIASPPAQMSFDLMIEREHTLMLAEIELVGPRHAWNRVAHLLQNQKVCDADRRLLLADFFAELLSRSLPCPEEAQLSLDLLKSGDPFEREMAFLLEFPESSAEHVQKINRAAAELSWASYLRLLTVHHQMAAGTPWQSELANKLSVLLSALSPTSRYYWMKRIQARVFKNDLNFEFHRPHRSILFQGKTLDLSKRRTLCSVFEKLSLEREVDVDALIHHLWQSDFSPEHLHRLRMTVHRLNQLLFDLSAIPRVIEMTAEKVSLKGSIRIQAVG